MSHPGASYRIGLLEDLVDPEEAMAYLGAALEDGDNALIRLALSHVIEAQEIGQDDDDLRFSPEGWALFRTLMTQAEESFGTFCPQVDFSGCSFYATMHS